MVNKILFSLVALVSLPSFGMEMTKIERMKAPRLNVELFHNDEGFFVKKNEVFHKAVSVKGEQKLNSKQLKSILNQGGYFNVEDIGNNNYRVNHKSALKGSGPIAAYWAYGITKGTCYSVGVAGAGAAVIATGGVAGAVTGVIAGGATLAAGPAVTLGACAIAGAGGTAAAGTALAAGAAASGGSMVVLAGAVEAASLAVGAFFLWLPIP